MLTIVMAVHCKPAGPGSLLTVPSDQSVALVEIRECFTMDIKKFIPLNFSQLWPQKGLLQICTAQSKR